MTLIDMLDQYKAGIVALGRTPTECKFLEDSFTRWYFAVPKSDLMPLVNVVVKGDLQYANAHRGCNFQVATVLSLSGKKFTELQRKVAKSQDVYPNQDNLISEGQMQRLRDIYKGKDFEADKNKLIAIYKFVGINSAHLSIPPIFGGIELFGSPLNTHNPFCSPFEFERAFGSLGSFFKFSISKSKESLFTCNPPFDEDIMTKMAAQLEDELNAADKLRPKTIIITIPVWDSASQHKLGIRDYGMDFAAFDALMASKYLAGHEILDRAAYPYWDYYQEKLLPVSYTHLIVLTTGKSKYSINGIKAKWTEFATSN